MSLAQLAAAAHVRPITQAEWQHHCRNNVPANPDRIIVMRQTGGAFGDYHIEGHRVRAYKNQFYNAAIIARMMYPNADIRSA